jgi:hypothetical protein
MLLLRQAHSAVDKLTAALSCRKGGQVRRRDGVPAQPPMWRPSLSLASETPSSCRQVVRPRWRQDGRCAGFPRRWRRQRTRSRFLFISEVLCVILPALSFIFGLNKGLSVRCTHHF